MVVKQLKSDLEADNFEEVQQSVVVRLDPASEEEWQRNERDDVHKNSILKGRAETSEK